MDPKIINNMLGKVALFRDNGEKLRVLSLGIYNNSLRLYVKEMSKDRKKNKLLFTMSIPSDKVRILLAEMENLDRRELKDNKYEFEIAIYGLKWDNNNKPLVDEKDYIGSFGVGKVKNENNEVINFLFIKSKAETRYVFPFLKTPYEEFFINGERVTDKTLISKLKLESYKRLLEDVVASFLELQTPNLDNKPKNDNTTSTNKENKSSNQDLDVDDIF